MPSKTKLPALSPGAIDAIVNAYHGDPFAVLGPHEEKHGVVIRAILPHVATATIKLADDSRHAMTRIHPTGLFELFLEGVSYPLTYTYELTNGEGQQWTELDPYAFPPAFLYPTPELYENMGAHIITHQGVQGTRFAVWAPSAERVSVVGNFNNWDGRRHPMRKHHDFGTWEIFIPNVGEGALYKYEIKTFYQGYTVAKSDPVGFFAEMRPKTASVVWDINKYQWQDAAWVANRTQYQGHSAPISVYEIHPGSWKRDEKWEWLTYRELAEQLIPYLKEMGYTHVELMPVSEHPFDGSWGYQVTGYFAPTSRFGTPEDFMAFVDACHQNGIGVLLDWVPAHFPKDQHGLSFFDGTHLYEHADPRQGEHPDWGTYIFNYGRDEVRKFLIDNALFWIEKYHIDGLRVDAVASMLYLDFSREAGQWVPNRYGGRENLEAISFLREMNTAVHERFPGVITVAEESTAWGGVTRPPAEGGLGFDYKWNMGWMNDTLRYMSTEPIFRSYHQGTLTFSLLYAFSEKFILPFSHDEVVHLKKSLVDKMPGDAWQKFANLRALLAYQYAHPGRKLNFMGNEIGQWQEWQEEQSVHWHLLQEGKHHLGMQKLVRDLNHLYTSSPALYAADDNWEGFSWIDFRDALHSIIAFSRQVPSEAEEKQMIVVCNFTPEVRQGYRIGVPFPGMYAEVMNTDAEQYGGSNVVNPQKLEAVPIAWQDLPYSVQITLPPLGVVYLQRVR
jgi:1,4-alpha-glucan branching enzyme